MDPVTQFALGAVAAQAAFGKQLGKRAWLIGGLAGAAPDLDILLRSDSDPLFAIEMHRHFTHSLAFIPIGGALAALPWLASSTARSKAKWIFLASILGYATHGLLDACTTYGTHLLWPFSNLRVSWDIVAIIDPLFTLTLIAGMVWAARTNSMRPAGLALALGLTYLGFGAVQHKRALDAQAEIAQVRGHIIERGAAFPSIGNNKVWRSLYRVGNTYYADRISISWGGAKTWQQGTSMRAVESGVIARMPDRIQHDFARFAHFSNGWVAYDPKDASVYADARYSLSPHEYRPIWGVRFDQQATVQTQWVSRSGERRLSMNSLWHSLSGQSDSFRTIAR